MEELRKVINDLKTNGLSLTTLLRIVRELYRASK